MLIADGISLTICKCHDEKFTSKEGISCALSSLNEIGVKVEKIIKHRSGYYIWPSNVVCSISHKNQNVISIAAYKHMFHGIGIDLEIISSYENITEATNVFLSTEEHKIICNFDELDYGTAMYVIFSAKESSYKAISDRIESPLIFCKLALTDIQSISPFYGICKMRSLYKNASIEIHVEYIIKGQLICTIATYPDFIEYSKLSELYSYLDTSLDL